MWVVGGGTAHAAYNDVWRTSEAPSGWVKETGAAEWAARVVHSVAASPDKMFLTGGYVLQPPPAPGVFESDVWSSADGKNWTQVTKAAGWGPRGSHSSAWFQNSLFVFGGYWSQTAYRDVWKSTDGGATWVEVTKQAGWTARGHMATAVLMGGNTLIMAGGQALGGSGTDDEPPTALPGRLLQRSRRPQTIDSSEMRVTPYNDVWSTTDGTNWNMLTAKAPWSKRAAAALVSTASDEAWLLGGAAQAATVASAEVWHTEDGGTTWSLVTRTAQFGGRASPGAALQGDSIVILGGSHSLSDPVYYDDAWVSLPALKCERDGLLCEGHGGCTANSTCACAIGWAGSFCNVSHCSPAACSHGTCHNVSSPAGASVCKCDDGWSGFHCATPVCVPACEHGLCATPGSCECDDGWSGVACDTREDGGPELLKEVGTWVTDNAPIAYTSVGGAGAGLLLLGAGYANYWARRPAVRERSTRRVRFADEM